jgi:hypothetical protein
MQQYKKLTSHQQPVFWYLFESESLLKFTFYKTPPVSDVKFVQFSLLAFKDRFKLTVVTVTDIKSLNCHPFALKCHH